MRGFTRRRIKDGQKASRPGHLPPGISRHLRYNAPMATNPLYRSERLISYSDAIFSIALTLLVIEIKLPEDLGHGLLAALGGSWPSLLSFIISFLIITVVWFNHHEMFHHIRMVDYRLIIYNTLLMLNIIFIPYVSSILGRAFLLPPGESQLACLIYGLWIALGGLPFNLLWHHAVCHSEVFHEGVDTQMLKSLSRHYWQGPALYFLAALGALINIWISIGAYMLLILMFFVPGSALRKRRRGVNP